MSFLAKLVLGSSEFNIISIDYDIIQPVDQQGKPNGRPKGGMINVIIESSNKNDLAEWMISPTMKKSGQITFFKRDANSSMKTMSFNDAYCVYYKEKFNAVTEHQMTIEIKISDGELKLNNTSMSKPRSSLASMAQAAVPALCAPRFFDTARALAGSYM